MMIVGIDVSKASFDATWEGTGRDKHRQYAYTDEGIAALLEQTPEDAHYVMEATGIYHCRATLAMTGIHTFEAYLTAILLLYLNPCCFQIKGTAQAG